MRIRVGTVVQGEDFFDREHILDELREHLESSSLLLLAPRRVGKTSLMRKLEGDARSRGWRCFHLDVAACRDEFDFIRRLYEEAAKTDPALSKHFKEAVDAFKGFLGRIRKISGGGANIELDTAEALTWNEWGKRLIDLLKSVEGNWLIQIDELPVFLLNVLHEDGDNGWSRIQLFLNWLRTLRQESDNIRWVFAGSIGLDTVARKHNLVKTINDLRITHLGAFDDPTARSFLAELGSSYGMALSKEAIDRILERLGWPLPYYLQLIFDRLHSLYPQKGASPSPGDVDKAYEELLAADKRNYFDTWSERLDEQLDKVDADLARIVLAEICRDPKGTSTDTLKQALANRIADADERGRSLKDLLSTLETDGYVVTENGRTFFRSGLLRDYWLKWVAP